MRLSVGPEPRWRWSIHFFRDKRPQRPTFGVHVKLRRFSIYRHFIVKVRGGSAFGRNNHRRELWIGWFQSRDGVRGLVNGWRWTVNVDRMRDFQPGGNSEIPIYPSKPRDRQAEFEVR